MGEEPEDGDRVTTGGTEAASLPQFLLRCVMHGGCGQAPDGRGNSRYDPRSLEDLPPLIVAPSRQPGASSPPTNLLT